MPRKNEDMDRIQYSRDPKRWVVELRGRSPSRKNVLVFSPSFTADCLETIIEIGDEYNELFINSGGQKLDYVESLNYSDLWSDAIISIIK